MHTRPNCACRTSGCLFLAIAAWSAQPAFTQELQDSFGEQQLTQIFNDRPKMKGIVDENDIVHRWVVRQFNSRDSLHRVYWDSKEPRSGRPAEHCLAYADSPACIRIASTETISGRDLWLYLVYELHNLKNEKSFRDLWEKACAGSIDRACYADECVLLEFQALVHTQMFFRQHPIPGANAANDPNYSRVLNGTGDFQDYKKMLDSDGADAYDPREYFGRHFDQRTGRSWSTWWNSQSGSELK